MRFRAIARFKQRTYIKNHATKIFPRFVRSVRCGLVKASP